MTRAVAWGWSVCGWRRKVRDVGRLEFLRVGSSVVPILCYSFTSFSREVVVIDCRYGGGKNKPPLGCLLLACKLRVALHVLNSILLSRNCSFLLFSSPFYPQNCFILLAVLSASILLSKFGLSWPILRHCAATRPTPPREGS